MYQKNAFKHSTNIIKGKKIHANDGETKKGRDPQTWIFGNPVVNLGEVKTQGQLGAGFLLTSVPFLTDSKDRDYSGKN